MNKKRYYLLLSVILGCILLLLLDYSHRQKINQSLNTQYCAIKTALNEGSLTPLAARSQLEDLIDPTTLTYTQTQFDLHQTLTSLCILQQDYGEAIQYGVTAIHIASALEDNYAESIILLDLSDMFISLDAYDTAKELIQRALDLTIELPENKNYINKFAYLNLAHIAFQEADYTLSYQYITEATFLANPNTRYYEEHQLIQHLLHARLALVQKDFATVFEILDTIAEPIQRYGNRWVPHLDLEYALILGWAHLLNSDASQGLDIINQALIHCNEQDLYKTKLSVLEKLLLYLEQNDYVIPIKELQKYTYQLMQEYHHTTTSLTIENINHTIQAYKYNETLILSLEDRLVLTRVSALVGLLILIVMTYLAFRLNKIKASSRMDCLTRVYNRKAFNQDYKKCQLKYVPITLILIDIDYFKQINDSYGHEVGDIVLRGIAKVISNKLPPNASLYRFGGEEFCILYNTHEQKDVLTLAELLRTATASMLWREGFTVTISIGIASSAETTDLFDLADKRLYTSKQNGRNQITYK